MEIQCIFDWECPNPYFKYIYRGIYEQLKIKYPEYDVVHINFPTTLAFSAPGSGSCFQIVNPANNKSIVMSFWDRGMDIFIPNIGWEKYQITQYIGGLGMNMTSAEIKETYGITHIPFQYPLGMPRIYDYIDEAKQDYDPEKKIRKAVFMGAMYGVRDFFREYTKGHPLIDIIAANPEDYPKKLSEYRLGLSFNGNGEICMRDFEIIGVKIPLVRSELFTQLYNPFIPNYHYIKATERHDEAKGINSDHKKLTEEYISVIESVIDDYDKLIQISKNGSEYFENYCRPDYMINLFLDIADIHGLN